MAENKANEPDDARGDPTEGTGADMPDQQPEVAADDGYTPASDDDLIGLDAHLSASDGDALGVPSGDELADEDLPQPESFTVMDDQAEELDESADADQSIDEDQLEQGEAEVAALTSTEPSSKRPQARTGSQSAAVMAAKKNRPTRSRAEATASDAPKKGNLFTFVGQVVQELKKVSWPTGAQLAVYFVVVLFFVVFMIAFIGLLDVFFGWVMLKLFG
ncbi:MAG: preprotein translocase subunit SecE [Propionibacteriaceae bacterium]|nr:preprotein translocase subunit SecE [Propionibacteriaceae bacterium]